MANARLYPFWADLTEGLRSGSPQNEVKRDGKPLFEELYSDPDRLEQFMQAMAGISQGPCMALAEKLDFSKYETLCDAGGATGLLTLTVAGRHPHMSCTSFDLPPVEPIAKKAIEAAGLGDRVSTAAGDFFADALPKADVITMGMVLHNWNLEQKKQLMRAAYDALPDGGAFITVENVIDDARRENAFGLLMSLNMLIETGDGFAARCAARSSLGPRRSFGLVRSLRDHYSHIDHRALGLIKGKPDATAEEAFEYEALVGRRILADGKDTLGIDEEATRLCIAVRDCLVAAWVEVVGQARARG
jgi:hypothetical protein